MFAIEDSASIFCAPRHARHAVHGQHRDLLRGELFISSGFCAGQMKVTRICPSRIDWTSSGVGARTLKMMSARDQTEAASGTTVAPAAA